MDLKSGRADSGASRRKPRGWLSDRPIAFQFGAIALSFAAVVISLLGIVIATNHVTTGVRHFVEGGRRWMRAEDKAAYFLVRYIHTHDYEDYLNCLDAFVLPATDRRIRLELEKPQFDRALVERDMLDVGTDPADVPMMISLFRKFHDVGPVAQTNRVWAEGDERTLELIAIANHLHDAILGGTLSVEDEHRVFERISDLSRQLEQLEDTFAATLDEDAAMLERAALWTLLCSGALLLGLGVWVCWLISRRLRASVAALREGAARVAQGDLDTPITVLSADEMGQLSAAFNSMMDSRKHAEATLRKERLSLKSLLENIHAVPWEMNAANGSCEYIGPQAEQQWRWPAACFAEPGFFISRVHKHDRAALAAAIVRLPSAGTLEAEFRIRKSDGSYAHVRSLLSHARVVVDGQIRDSVRGVSIDITRQRLLELELQQAQKLESVGRLAAGVAHEINTPVQFVNDSCHFVRDGLADLQGLLGHYREALQSLANGQGSPDQVLQRLKALEQAADVDYLMENMPGAIDRSLDGLQRVATIVRSMKEFAHPDQKDMASADLNQAILSTLTIARNEYKYVADIKTELGDLPQVCCFPGDFNQAVLNIVVNAAHAIEEKVRDSGQRGCITIRTRQQGEDVLISIQDTGGGIPESVRGKIFDPFFTTKEVGKGTGQGLAIARSVIVDKHHGELRFDTDPGVGTTFHIRLPIQPSRNEQRAAA
jgi:signal transduction histidine kinase